MAQTKYIYIYIGILQKSKLNKLPWTKVWLFFEKQQFPSYFDLLQRFIKTFSLDILAIYPSYDTLT